MKGRDGWKCMLVVGEYIELLLLWRGETREENIVWWEGGWVSDQGTVRR